ncbi:MAG: macro domain-containing protein [Gemmatimonadota bacterium]
MIRIRRGDLCDAVVDAIMRPLDSEGRPVSPVGRRVELAAGPTLASRIDDLGELPVGGAVITPAGELPAAFVIHVVDRSREESPSPLTLHRALVNGLRRASEWGVGALAVPPVGLGPGTMEPEDAARVLLDALREHLDTGVEPREVTIVVESDFEEELYRRMLSAAALTDGM